MCYEQLWAQTSLPVVEGGRIERLSNFESKFVSSRNIDIWLPEGYNEKTKYAVLYMHDGQMLFDPDQTWNRQSWNVDSVATRLFSIGTVRKFIVVGIWNGGQTRHQDYFPQKPFDNLFQKDKDTIIAQLRQQGRSDRSFQPVSDNYLRFIVQELKPLIDNKYSVYTDAENTMIAGSSMGGLISLYAICEYPKVFGGAACLSTHWPGSFTLDHNPFPEAYIQYLSEHLPNPNTHRIYFDCGDQTLDALYPGIQKRIDSLMIAKGYSSRNWDTKYFPGDDHSERSWSRRLAIPIEFLFRRK